MVIERQQFLNTEGARRLGFRGAYVVSRISEPLYSTWADTYAEYLRETPELSEQAIAPEPHLTLCWIESRNLRKTTRAISQWSQYQEPFKIQISGIETFSTPPNLPYIAIANDNSLVAARTLLIQELQKEDIGVSEELNPHLSLFYMSMVTWESLADRIIFATSRISVLATECVVRDVELVRFERTGRQRLTAFPLKTH